MMNADTPDGQRAAIAELKSMRLGQIKFEITESRLANGQPPLSADWVKFTGVVTAPSEFHISGKLSLTYVECPAVADEVIENIRNPKRHNYLLSAAR